MKKSASLVLAGALLSAACFTTGCTPGFYSQDVGEVSVIRGMGGTVNGSESNPGFHLSSPFDDIITYSTRNNVISFMGDEAENYNDGNATGPKVSCNDASGTSFEADVQVNYSLDPSYAEQLYIDYGTQENHAQYVVAVDVRSVTREVAGKMQTLALLTDRGSFTSSLQEALAQKWEGKGIVIEQVSVQGIRYPQSITDRYAEAQASEIMKAKALNEQESRKVEAETRVIEAQGIAEANRVLAESLSAEVLAQNYIDALKEIGANGNLVVVPEGSSPVVVAGKEG